MGFRQRCSFTRSRNKVERVAVRGARENEKAGDAAWGESPALMVLGGSSSWRTIGGIRSLRCEETNRKWEGVHYAIARGLPIIPQWFLRAGQAVVPSG